MLEVDGCVVNGRQEKLESVDLESYLVQSSNRMHEMGIAEEIFRCVEAAAEQNGASAVNRLTVEVGVHAGVEKRSLLFCLEAISSGTILEGARIDIRDVFPSVVCNKCGTTPTETFWPPEPVCPLCGAPSEVVPATDILIREVELDVQEN